MIEGIWKFAMDGEDGNLYWIFNNNVFVRVESGDPTPDYGTYEYDEDEQVLVVFEDIEGPSEYKVVELTLNNLKLQIGGETVTFTRYNGSIQNLEDELNLEIEI